MNWTLFWALVICFGLIIGNLMMLKHLGKPKLPDELKNKFPTSKPPKEPEQNAKSKSEPED